MRKNPSSMINNNRTWSHGFSSFEARAQSVGQINNSQSASDIVFCFDILVIIRVGDRRPNPIGVSKLTAEERPYSILIG